MKQPEYKSDRQKYCHECGSVIVRHAEICPRCGVTQNITHVVETIKVNNQKPHFDERKNRHYETQNTDHSRVIAGILAIAFGSVGAHKFYMGKWAQGLIYLMLFWTIIPGFLGFVEGIIYLMQDENRFQKRLK